MSPFWEWLRFGSFILLVVGVTLWLRDRTYPNRRPW